MADKFWFGQSWDVRSGRTGRPVISEQNRHVTVFGPTRSGKGVSIEIPNLLRCWDSAWNSRRFRCDSIVSIDPKAENAAVTMKWRSRFSTVWVVNPLGVLGIPSIGFNPLAPLDPGSPYLLAQAQAIADILVPPNRGADPFWPESAQRLGTFLIVWEVIRAAREGRPPSLANVHSMASEPVETATDADGTAYEVGGLRATAGRAIASGDPRVANLAAGFTQSSRTNDGIIATFVAATRWLAAEQMRADLSVKDGADFSRLTREQITCYIVLPAHALETFSGWLKLVVTSALSAIYQQGGSDGHGVRFMLSEFAQLGKLQPITAALAQGAGYGIQLAPIILQDMNQLRANFGRDQAETFLGMSGATFSFAANEAETAEWMSRRSGDRHYPGLSASDDPHGIDEARVSYSDKRERTIPPDAMYDLPPFHGLVWFAGRSAPQPVYAPPYWEIPHLRGRCSPNPYHRR